MFRYNQTNKVQNLPLVPPSGALILKVFNQQPLEVLLEHHYGEDI